MPYWTHVGSWYVCTASPVQQEVLWFNDIYPPHTARPAGISVPGQWHVIDLSHVVPEGTVCVLLGGILLITSEGGDVTDTLKVWLSADGLDSEEDYVSQATTVKEGERQAFFCVVPVNPDRTFRFKFTRTDTGAYPAGPAYGIRLWLQAFGCEGTGPMPPGQKRLYRNQPGEGWDTPPVGMATPVSER